MEGPAAEPACGLLFLFFCLLLIWAGIFCFVGQPERLRPSMPLEPFAGAIIAKMA